MQSRNFFTFGAGFNILTDSLMVAQFKLDAASIPPTATYIITEDSKNLTTESGNKFIAE